mgnify:CR=1 FL=1
MTYEEKRELRLQISQLLADAGLNQKVIKDIVNEEIRNKVERAVDQGLNSLNKQCSSGDYIKEQVNKIFGSANMNYHISQMIKDELKNRAIQIVLRDVEVVS